MTRVVITSMCQQACLPDDAEMDPRTDPFAVWQHVAQWASILLQYVRCHTACLVLSTPSAAHQVTPKAGDSIGPLPDTCSLARLLPLPSQAHIVAGRTSGPPQSAARPAAV